jgi:hypothetical protein
LSNDIEDEEVEIDADDILNLTLAKIKRSGKIKKKSFGPNRL